MKSAFLTPTWLPRLLLCSACANSFVAASPKFGDELSVGIAKVGREVFVEEMSYVKIFSDGFGGQPLRWLSSLINVAFPIIENVFARTDGHGGAWSTRMEKVKL